MPKVTLRQTFTKDLDGLRRSSRKHYQRACEILLELQRDKEPSAQRRSESRIPECVKYELPDGYRLVLQRAEKGGALVALAVGTHDHVESFLDGHKGYVFDPKSMRVRELRLATSNETSIDIAPSPDLLSRTTSEPSVDRVFDSLSQEMLVRLGVPSNFTERVRRIEDPNSLDCMMVLEDLAEHAPSAADALLSFATGNLATRQAVIEVATGNANLLQQFPAAAIDEPGASTEEFVTFKDPEGLAHVLDYGTLQQWQLFLHPDQRQLVEKSFAGPARLRGISGSGKTVVALHRARRLALDAHKSGKFVLFTTYDKGLTAAASTLLDSLCGPERSWIEVTHLHRWCLDYIAFRGIQRPRYSPEASREVQAKVLASLPPRVQEALAVLPRDYLWQEIEFLMGRFLHEDVEKYLHTDRTGRGRALTLDQRRAILDLYQAFHSGLFARGYVEPAEFVRIAYRLRQENQPTEKEYSTVIVDEMQDLSEIGLRVLHSLVGNRTDGLMLVGDTTQRIFTRGYSLKGLGIDISGRGIVLRKNYRNTRQILEAAFPLVAAEWKEDATQAGLSVAEAQPEFSVREGMKPIVVRCKNEKAEERFLGAEVGALLKYRHYTPRDICIVARNRHYRELAVAALRGAGIPVYQSQRSAIGEVSADENAVRVSSLHGAKGHEFGTVFVVGVVDGVVPLSNAVQVPEAAVLYVGMTRARDLLYLSYSEENSVGVRRKRSTFIDRIAGAVDEVEFHH